MYTLQKFSIILGCKKEMLFVDFVTYSTAWFIFNKILEKKFDLQLTHAQHLFMKEKKRVYSSSLAAWQFLRSVTKEFDMSRLSEREEHAKSQG